jgi:hypothetical protein
MLASSAIALNDILVVPLFLSSCNMLIGTNVSLEGTARGWLDKTLRRSAKITGATSEQEKMAYLSERR